MQIILSALYRIADKACNLEKLALSGAVSIQNGCNKTKSSICWLLGMGSFTYYAIKDRGRGLTQIVMVIMAYY